MILIMFIKKQVILIKISLHAILTLCFIWKKSIKTFFFFFLQINWDEDVF